MIEFARRAPSTLITIGALAIIFGLVASLWPIGTAVTLVIMWGAYALADGIAALVMAFRKEGTSARALLIFTGVIGVIAGLFAIFRPVSSGVALAWVLGIWLIARGITELAGAFAQTSARPRWLLALGGVAWILAGVLFAASPGAAALTIALRIGFLAIAWGVLAITAGLILRAESKQAETGTTT